MMKENKYDNDLFFKKYSQMGRSKDGLLAAGEWETLKQLLPDFHGKRVLDLGCGYGWHCIYAMEQGAASVVGVDISQKMLAVAREKTSYPEVDYLCLPMEEVDFPSERFDIVISSLALHYTPDYEPLVQKIQDMLTPGGCFVFSAEHPVFTAEGSQDWVYDEQGSIRHFPVDNYYVEGKRIAPFLGEPVVKYHRTLTTYLNTLLSHGFSITQIVEPQPSDELCASVPGMKDELRRPMMLLVSAMKND